MKSFWSFYSQRNLIFQVGSNLFHNNKILRILLFRTLFFSLKIFKINDMNYIFLVCPHAGGVGLCQMVAHIIMIDFISISASLENRSVFCYCMFRADFRLKMFCVKLGMFWPTFDTKMFLSRLIYVRANFLDSKYFLLENFLTLNFSDIANIRLIYTNTSKANWDCAAK